MSGPFVLLATTVTEAPAAGGLDENLIQILFAAIVLVGAAIAALLYVGSSLAEPWRRALSNTDRQALINALMITGIAGLVGTYTLVEPGRQQQAEERQLEHSVSRGVANYAQYCVACHGIAGTGGPVPAESKKGDSAFAPPLANRSDFRPESAIEMAQRADVIRKTVERGRPNTSMPAWSTSEGGALSSQDIDDLVNFIQHGDFAEVRNHMTPQQIASVEATAVAGGAQAGGGEGGPGKALFVSKGCVACHTIQGVSSGTVGPNLTHLASIPQIAGVLENNKDNLIKWLENPPGVKPGTAMPNLGLSAEEAGQLADYLESLK